ncbi:MAG: 3-isopropylmalate dehydrogenase [Planctomycetota bacterium]|jgi:3-isopropylmalate dehydrogenase
MHTIAVIPGDGIGEEVVREALRVLEAVSSVTGFRYRLETYPYGAEHYLKTGEAFPESALREMKDHSAILLGAIGDPRIETGYLERAIIAGIRFGLDLYVNLRPIKLYAAHLCPLKDVGPAQLDLTVVRENTEGAYVGLGGLMKKDSENEVALCNMVWTRAGTERVIRYAFELARRRGKAKRVTLVDKANAIRPMDLWTRTFERIGGAYPEIERDHAYVDAACMWLVKNPDWFDVVVTSNLFGDIITDLGAMLQGGLGIAASGNLHPGQVSMFEPIHGSAPKYRGKNAACPVAAVMAVQMMLDFLGDADGATLVENAVADALRTRKIPSLHAGDLPTDRAGDVLIDEIKAQAAAAG